MHGWAAHYPRDGRVGTRAAGGCGRQTVGTGHRGELYGGSSLPGHCARRSGGGATIRFNCGSTPATIFVTAYTLVIPNSTKIHGGDMVTLTMKREGGCNAFGGVMSLSSEVAPGWCD